jgi:hypothetical protein
VYKLAITNDEAGQFQTKLMKYYRTSINSNAAPAINDNLAKNPNLVIQRV